MQLKNPHKTTTDLLQSLFFPNWRRNAGAQTLAVLKQEAVRDKGKKHAKDSEKSKEKNCDKAVKRSSKRMREKLFKSMTCTRVFVSGPIDPRWNP